MTKIICVLQYYFGDHWEWGSGLGSVRSLLNNKVSTDHQ